MNKAISKMIILFQKIKSTTFGKISYRRILTKCVHTVLADKNDYKESKENLGLISSAKTFIIYYSAWQGPSILSKSWDAIISNNRLVIITEIKKNN